MNFDTQIVSVSPVSREDASPIVPDNVPNIAGYALVRCIGSGGYGEVWEAVGPGGLPKAVKVLHGRINGRQAETELKALERIRQLRHPFLINLERFEIVNGQLVVVMELAECSLEQRFEALTHDGAVGIPRDELLRYLSDAAEALDFMYEQHGFQHLDVKPANLLVQSGHVKVGDFGLTKDLQQSQVSIMSGFTPAYAAPELFEGKASRNSDQYALAVLYQNMLTGTLPFAGRTMAQLASQHLRGTPDLSPLPLTDRRVVSRALTKHATARFPTCIDFVKSLIEQGKSKESGATFGRQLSGVKNDRNGLAETQGARDEAPSIQKIIRPPMPLPASNPVEASISLRPTVFLGVGGLGGKIVQALRQRFLSQHGDVSRFPAFRFLSLDCDAAGQRELLSGESRLLEDEVLSIPLRSSAEYRAESPNLLPWISRRWLFNIPRSQQTAGIRSLGRLALVDHAEAVREKLGSLFKQAAAADSLKLTSRTLDLPFDATGVDVVLAGSAIGGMSSGTIMDLAYLAKHQAEAERSPLNRVLGVILLPTPLRKSADHLSQANAHAWLGEWKRFSLSIHGFPGDPSCRLPPSDHGPFDDTYLIHCKECSINGYQESVDEVAEYLFQRSSTIARGFFDACRDKEAAAQTAPKEGVRAFGLAGSSIGKKRSTKAAARRLASAVVANWISDAPGFDSSGGTNDSNASDESPSERIARELNATAVVSFVSTQCRRLIGEQVRPLVKLVLDNLAHALDDRCLRSASDDLHTMIRSTEHSSLATTGASEIRRCLAEPQQVCRRVFECVMEQNRSELLEGRRSLVDTAAFLDSLIPSAVNSQQTVQSALDTLVSELQKLREEYERLATSQSTTGSEPSDASRDVLKQRAKLESAVSNYAMLEICAAIHQEVRDALKRGVGELKQWQSVVAKNLAYCTTIRDRLTAAKSAGPNNLKADVSYSDELDDAERSTDVARCAAQARHLFKKLFASGAGDEITDPNSFQQQLLRTAEQFVTHDESVPQAPPATTKAVVDGLATKLPQAGGNYRCFSLGSDTSEDLTVVRELEGRLETTAARIPSDGGELLLGFESWRMDPDLVLSQIVGSDPAVMEMAKRLHSRIDVNW